MTQVGRPSVWPFDLVNSDLDQERHEALASLFEKLEQDRNMRHAPGLLEDQSDDGKKAVARLLQHEDVKMSGGTLLKYAARSGSIHQFSDVFHEVRRRVSQRR